MILSYFIHVSGEEGKLNAMLNKLGKIVQSKPQCTGLKRQYDLFIKERRWVDEAYVQEWVRKREL